MGWGGEEISTGRGVGLTRVIGIPGVGILGPMVYPSVLTPSGSHQNTYSWQANSTHPTGMLSFQCYFRNTYMKSCGSNNQLSCDYIGNQLRMLVRDSDFELCCEILKCHFGISHFLCHK